MVDVYCFVWPTSTPPYSNSQVSVVQFAELWRRFRTLSRGLGGNLGKLFVSFVWWLPLVLAVFWPGSIKRAVNRGSGYWRIILCNSLINMKTQFSSVEDDYL